MQRAPNETAAATASADRHAGCAQARLRAQPGAGERVSCVPSSLRRNWLRAPLPRVSTGAKVGGENADSSSKLRLPPSRRSSPSVSTRSSIPSSETMPRRSSMAAANCTRPRLSRCRSSVRCSSSPTPGCGSPEICAISASSQSSEAPKAALACGFAAPLPFADAAAWILVQPRATALRRTLPVEVRGRSGSGHSTQRRTR